METNKKKSTQNFTNIPATYCGISSTATNIPDSDGGFSGNILIEWYVLNRCRESIEERISVVNNHKLVDPPIYGQENEHGEFDYRPDVIAESFNKMEMESVKKVLDDCPNIISIEVFEYHQFLNNHLPYQAIPLATNDRIITLESFLQKDVNFPDSQLGHQVVGRFRM